jgi:hypothetical protein
MEYWKNENEPIQAFVKLFEAAMIDDELTSGWVQSNLVA